MIVGNIIATIRHLGYVLGAYIICKLVSISLIKVASKDYG